VVIDDQKQGTFEQLRLELQLAGPGYFWRACVTTYCRRPPVCTRHHRRPTRAANHPLKAIVSGLLLLWLIAKESFGGGCG
jgi:hypothetical protein